MAGKGPSGAILPTLAVPTVLPTSHEKCPKSPGKRKYYNLMDAESAAEHSARQYSKPMRAYVCDGCGLYHVTGKVTYGDVTSSREDGVIVTAGMSTRAAWKSNPLAPVPVERADMSEVIAMESPIVAGNAAAREKLVAQYVTDHETVTVPEVMEALSLSRDGASAALKSLGWQGMRGRKEWFPPGAEAPTVKPESILRAQRKGTKTREQLRASRRRKLKAWLAERESTTTTEAQVYIGAGKDMTKELMRELGWNPGWGANAKWTPGEDKLAHRRRVVPTEAEIEAAPEGFEVYKGQRKPKAAPETPVTVEESVQEPIDLSQRRHPAGAALQAGVTEGGWRPVPDVTALAGKQVSQIIEELAVYGLEIRIEIREKR